VTVSEEDEAESNCFNASSRVMCSSQRHVGGIHYVFVVSCGFLSGVWLSNHTTAQQHSYSRGHG
jgi:hypothetical protein